MDWIVASGEKIGLSHVRVGLPCQDKTSTIYKNDTYVVALSDGCSSASHSEIGASITTKFLCEYLSSNFDRLYEMQDDEIKEEIVSKLTEQFIKYIRLNLNSFSKDLVEYETKKKDLLESKLEFLLDTLSATLLFVAKKEDKTIIGHIGDGYIGAVIDNKLSIVSYEPKDDSSEATAYTPGVYCLLNLDASLAYKEMRIQKLCGEHNGTAFILISDGFSGVLNRVSSLIVFKPLVNKMFSILCENPDEFKEVLNEEILDYAVKQSIDEDDCSIALLVNKNYEIESYKPVDLRSYSNFEFELNDKKLPIEEKNDNEKNIEVSNVANEKLVCDVTSIDEGTIEKDIEDDQYYLEQFRKNERLGQEMLEESRKNEKLRQESLKLTQESERLRQEKLEQTLEIERLEQENLENFRENERLKQESLEQTLAIERLKQEGSLKERLQRIKNLLFHNKDM